MKKLSIYQNFVAGLKSGELYQIGSKSLYVRTNDNQKFDFFSYNTKIAEFDKISNILSITKKFYSMTTSKHKTIIKRNFTDSKILEI